MQLLNLTLFQMDISLFKSLAESLQRRQFAPDAPDLHKVALTSTLYKSGEANMTPRLSKYIAVLPAPPTVDFDHTITQYQFNMIQSSLVLKRKRKREREKSP